MSDFFFNITYIELYMGSMSVICSFLFSVSMAAPSVHTKLPSVIILALITLGI